MFGRKQKKAEANLLKAMDMMRYRVEYIGSTGTKRTTDFLSLCQALCSVSDCKDKTLSTVIISQCVPGTEHSRIVMVYDVKHDILTSPLL